ncbi:MAG: PLP-dependent aminotransferase family protein [Thermaerobacter sp.]|nr:PLP-dependent aminotransferase family protein [Thermaerobacter sp.]
MFLALDRTLPRPLWQQLVDALIEQMAHGQLPVDDVLPPTRDLAHILGVSRSTVQVAYEELFARGYVTTSGKGGTRVIAVPAPHRDQQAPQMTGAPVVQLRPDPIAEELADWLQVNAVKPLDINFRHQEPWIDDHFRRAWRRAAARALSAMKPEDWGYQSPYGTSAVRHHIRDYLAVVRGITVDTNQILMTSGAQHAVDLIAQTLLARGATAAVEDPGFPGARLTLAYRGIQVVGVPVDADGMQVDAIPASARLIFVTPTHQRPTGVVLSASRRQHLLDLAHQHGAWIVEDDFDSEYRYRGGPLPPLFADAGSHVLYILTFSKLLTPALRLAAIVGPAPAMAQLANVHSLIDRHLPIMEQLTLAEFMRAGDFTRHLRRMRQLYRTRHEILMRQLMDSRLARLFRIHGAETGLHIFLEADPTFSEEAAVEAAANRGVGIYPLRPYRYRGSRRGLLMGFAQTDQQAIAEGVRRLDKLCGDGLLGGPITEK